MDGTEAYRRLIESLQLLAADAESQTGAFPDFVWVAEEIALTFAECYDDHLPALIAGDFVGEAQQQALREIDERLDLMASDESLYSLESLRSAQAWNDLRVRAEIALISLGVQKRKPNLYWCSYFPG